MITERSEGATGLTVGRNKGNFIFKWKYKNESSMKNCTQNVMYHVKENNKWKNFTQTGKTIKSTTRSVTVSQNLDTYYPKTNKKLAGVEFIVNTKEKDLNDKVFGVKYIWSGDKYGSTTVEVPAAPKNLKFTLDSSVDNKGTFTWEHSHSDTNARPYVDCEYQSVYKTKWNDSQSANAFTNAKSYTTASSFSVASSVTTITRDESITHLVRVRARGAAGASDWKYIKHVYAVPFEPVVKTAKFAKQNNAKYVSVEFQTVTDNAHPVETVEVQYTIQTPDEKMKCPDGSGWTTVYTTARTGTTMKAGFNIDADIEKNKCLYVRAVAVHDKSEAYSSAYCVYNGTLSAPTLSDTVTVDTTAGKVTLTATNNASDIPDSYIKVEYRTTQSWYALGEITHNDSGKNITFENSSFKTCENNYQIRVKAVVQGNTDGMANYLWESDYTYSDWKSFEVPPRNLKVSAYNSNTALLEWDWSWNDATGVRIAWSDHEDAWYSTDSPSTFDLSDKVTSFHVTDLNENTYYFRVRFIDSSGEKDVYSDWSDTVKLNIASTPTTPTLAIQKTNVNIDGTITCNVGYSGMDTVTAEIAEYKNGVVTRNFKPFILTCGDNADNISIDVETINNIYERNSMTSYIWKEDETHQLVARVATNNGGTSETWSDAASVTIISKPSLSITTNLVQKEITDDEEEKITHTALCLTELPLTITPASSDSNGTIKVTIKRANDYSIARPDERQENRYAGETIAAVSQEGNETIIINLEDLAGKFDDDANYTLTATLTDSNDQVCSSEKEFEVHWTHQPETPTATAEITDTIAEISVNKPTGYAEGDVFDIYRLSVDLPELIASDCKYGTKYVDPYPTIGEFGGYRVVAKTANGDYITANNDCAWTDLKTNLESKNTIIDFNGLKIELPYNLSLSNKWTKDFTRTEYLGGSVVGDWNPTVTRDLTVTATTIATKDSDTAQKLRVLAEYTGICHIRTPEGSSFSCDIQISENRSGETANIVEFSLTIQKVDSQSLDGMTYEDWEAS